ncbi:MAG TPA: aldehyde dehydrogenase family protein, partial [Acidimicrobiales bacterium]
MTTVREAFEAMGYGPALESDKPALEWLAKHDAKFGHYIAGAWTKSASPFAVSNPATNEHIATVSQGSKKDVDAAVKAARK